jgi:hypothetical protein
MQLVTISRRMADEGRIVALTIHQPRPEIFCMFDRIVLLCAGSVVFQGSPLDVRFYLEQHPSLVGKGKTDDQLARAIENPADAVIDGLGSKAMQQLAAEWYARTSQAVTIVKAIEHGNERADKHWRTEAGIRVLERIKAASFVRDVDFRVALQTYTGRHARRNLLALVSYAAIIVCVSGVLTALLFRGVTSANQVVSEIMIIYALSAGLPPGATVGQYMMPLLVDEANDSVLHSPALLTHNILTGISCLGLQTLSASIVAYLIAINQAHWDFLQLWDFWVLLFANTITLEMAFWTFFYASGSRMPFNMYLIFVNILNGFVVARKDYLPGLHWLPMTGSMHWGVSGSMQVLLKNRTYCEFKEADPDPIIQGFTCFATSGDLVLEWFSISHISLYTSSVVLLGIFCLFSVLSVFGLGYFIGTRSDADPPPGSLVHRVMAVTKRVKSCWHLVFRPKVLVASENSAGKKSRKELEMRVMTSQMTSPEELKVIESLVILPHEYWAEKVNRHIAEAARTGGGDDDDENDSDVGIDELETLVEEEPDPVDASSADEGESKAGTKMAAKTAPTVGHNKLSMHGWGVLQKEVHTKISTKRRDGSQYTNFKRAQQPLFDVLRALQKKKKTADEVDLHGSFSTDEFHERRATLKNLN